MPYMCGKTNKYSSSRGMTDPPREIVHRIPRKRIHTHGRFGKIRRVFISYLRFGKIRRARGGLVDSLRPHQASCSHCDLPRCLQHRLDPPDSEGRRNMLRCFSYRPCLSVISAASLKSLAAEA